MGGSQPRYSLPGTLLLPKSFSVGSLTPGHTSPRGSRSQQVLLLLAILVGMLVISNVTQVWRYHPWLALQHMHPAGSREVVSFSSTVKVYEPYDQQRHANAAAAAAAAAAGMPFRVAGGSGKAKAVQRKQPVEERGPVGSPTADSSKVRTEGQQQGGGDMTVQHPGGTPTSSDALRIRSHSDSTLDQLRASVARLAETPPPPPSPPPAAAGAALAGSNHTGAVTAGQQSGTAESSTEQQAGGVPGKVGSSSSSASGNNSSLPEAAGATKSDGAPANTLPTAAVDGSTQPSAAANAPNKPPAPAATAAAAVPATVGPTAKVAPAACPPAAAASRVSPVAVPRVPGVPDSMYQYVTPAAGAAANATAAAAAGVQGLVRLKHPLWWFGPVWSGSGYGSEAVNYMLSLLRTGRVAPQQLWVSHHGDEQRDSVVAAMAPPDRFELHAMTAMPQLLGKQTGAIVVCHSMPTNWPWPTPMWVSGARCPPHEDEAGWVYTVGRTMFETDRLPRAFVPRINAMNEVWVPSPWQAASFIASGVDPNKVRVVPEGVNTTLYDPALYTPLALEKTAELVFGRSWADKALSRQQQQQRQQQTQQQAQHPEKQTAAGLRLQQQQQPLEDPQPAAVEGTSHPAAAPAATPQAPAAAEQARGAGTSELPPISSRPFVFLSTFKWERRKGWDVLLEAYLSEFTSEDDVELYILTKPYGKSGSGFQDMMQDWARDKLGGMQQGQGQGRAARQLLAHGGDLSDTKQLLRRGQGPAEGGAEVGSSLNQAAGAELDEQQQQQQLEELPEVSEEEFLHWYQQHNRQDVGVGGTAATAELFDTSRWQAGQAPWGMELTPLLNATTSSNHNAPGNAASSSSSSGSSTKEGGEASRTRGVRQQVHHIRSWLSSELLPRLQAAGAVPPHWLGTAPQPPAAGHINQQQQAQQQEEQVGSQTPAVAVAAQHDAGGGGPSRQLLQQPAAAVGGQRDAVVHVADDSVAGSRQDNTATVEVVPDAPVVDQEEKAQVAHTPATQSAGAVHSSTKANSSSPDESVPSVATLTPSGAVLVTAGGDTSGLLSGLQGSDPTLAAAAGGADTAAPAGPAFPTLYVVHRHISDEDFPRIYKAADAFVLPSRGEGWGRPHVEAMSMGLPVIATNWSGVTAYLDETVGYPLPIEDVVPVQAQADSEWWFRGLRWAQPSVKELRKLMRHVYENREEAAAKGAAARQRMVEKYSPPAIAEAVLKEVQRIERLLG